MHRNFSWPTNCAIWPTKLQNVWLFGQLSKIIIFNSGREGEGLGKGGREREGGREGEGLGKGGREGEGLGKGGSERAAMEGRGRKMLRGSVYGVRKVFGGKQDAQEKGGRN